MVKVSKAPRRSQGGSTRKNVTETKDRYMILRMDLFVTISKLEIAEVAGEWEIVERNVSLVAAIQQLSQFDSTTHQAVLLIWPQELPFPVHIQSSLENHFHDNPDHDATDFINRPAVMGIALDAGLKAKQREVVERKRVQDFVR